ncbi:hypothetical protein [Candidatus Methanoperedens nitratireducens]|uniref:Uncharacterized protein n=1 Tax=Candidatus Methanoperedens nitratireducens TaxID=1392998 RepID=A0A284VRR1_9EURY|nr:hypothetical protein [Candidatus Methanoperedens nitroreducens]SNQ61898.1 hypothetical protein MNV_510014 [Candidatus Methanoperedens nitroreducens]
MDPQNKQNKQKDPNLIQHPNGSVDDVDTRDAAGTGAPQRPSVIAALARDLGIEGDLIKGLNIQRN